MVRSDLPWPLPSGTATKTRTPSLRAFTNLRPTCDRLSLSSRSIVYPLVVTQRVTFFTFHSEVAPKSRPFMTTPSSADLDELLRELRQELNAARPLAKRPTQQQDPHVEHDDEDAFHSQWQKREQWLCDRLAHVLLELAQERSNLRLAANAGNSLLEQLDEAQDRVQALERELQTRQSDLERVTSDERRWREACVSMDEELRRMHSDLEGARLNTTNDDHFHRTQEARSQCTACQQHEREQMAQRQVIEELKRRCLSMEIEYERVTRSHTELKQHAEQHDAVLKQIQEEYDAAMNERNALVVQLQELQANQTNVLTTRENIRRTSHRLKAETLVLSSQVKEMQAHIDTLKHDRHTSLTQAQLMEMQLIAVQTENQQLQDQHQQLQHQLCEVQLSLQEFSTARQQAKDRDQLLDDATRQIEVLKADNRKLRWRMASQAALRRQAQVQTQNAGTTTCEAILAADRRVHQNSGIDNVANFQNPDHGSAKSLGPPMWNVDQEVMPLPSRAEPKLRFAEPVVAVSSARSNRAHSVGMSSPLLAQMIQRTRRQSAPVAPASVIFGSIIEDEKHLLDGGINEKSASEDEENGDSESHVRHTIPFAAERMQIPSNRTTSSPATVRDPHASGEIDNQDARKPQSLVSWLVVSRMTRLQPDNESGNRSPK